MRYPEYVKIVEVGPRDGLQNEREPISTDHKITLIEGLAAAGLPVIEATAFVSPKWVPQMADHKEVMGRISRHPGVSYPVLVPNLRGLIDAIDAGATEVAIFPAATESFTQRNLNCSIADNMQRIDTVVTTALAAGLNVRGYISCALGCPYEGDVAVKTVADLAFDLVEMGCYEISLGDTIGVATAASARRLVDEVCKKVAVEKLAAHFHDTYGQALANIMAVLEQGVAVVDSSVAGLGGCPYAKGATGNVATEDVVYLLNGLGIDSGIELDKLLEIGWFISDVLGREPTSRVSRAMRAKRMAD